MAAPEPRGRRARYREQTRTEAKAVALRQLAEGGTGALSLNAIAREIGMSGPALYRYFANRDALLTDLIIDAFDDLAAATEAAAEAARDRPPAERLRAVLGAFRRWGLAEPHRYLLLFGTPVPGYAAPPETILAAGRTMNVIMSALVDLADAAAPDALDAPDASGAQAGLDAPSAAVQLERQLTTWGRRDGFDALADQRPWLLRMAVTGWTRMHGVLSLEIQGGFHPMGFDPALLYAAEVDALLTEVESASGPARPA